MADAETAVLGSLEGGCIADKIFSDIVLYFIRDTDTEKSYVQIISGFLTNGTAVQMV